MGNEKSAVGQQNVLSPLTNGATNIDVRVQPQPRWRRLAGVVAFFGMAVAAAPAMGVPQVTATFGGGITTSVLLQNHTTITFTLIPGVGNPAVSNVNFVETLPSSLRVAPTPAKGGTCTNAVAATTAVAGATTITVANLQVPADPTPCTVTVDVVNVAGALNGSCATNPPAFTTLPANFTSFSNVTVNPGTSSCITVGTWPALQTPADRFGSGLNCTANDVSLGNVNVVGTTQCIFGQPVTLTLTGDISVTSTNRWDLAFFFSQDGKTLLDQSTAGGAASSSVATLTSADAGGIIANTDGDACYDGASGTRLGITLPVITLNCIPNPVTGFIDLVSLVSWDNTSGNNCGGGQDVVPNTKAKCTASTSASQIAALGQINITKVTVPATDLTSFNYSAANTTIPASVPTPTAFSLVGGATQQITTAQLTQAGQNYLITEAANPSFDLTSIVCTDGAGLPAPNVIVNVGARTVTANMSTVNGIVNCTYTNTRKSTLTVNKVVVPASDPGVFNLTANTTTVNNQGNGGTTGPVGVTPGAVPVSEAQGTGTLLSNYTATYACVDADTLAPITSGSGTSVPGGVTVAAAQSVVCTFTNTRNPSLTVNKVLSPALDGGLFNLSAGATTVNNQGNGGTTGAAPAVLGNAILAQETAGTGTSLANYSTTYSCNDSLNSAGSGTSVSVTPTVNFPAITCTFTNTRLTNTVTLNKILNPGGDTGLFNLLINGNTVATNVGNGGTGNLLNVPVGSTVTIAELAGTGTSLVNYLTAVACVPATVTPGALNQSGTFPMPNAPVSCNFTNTRKQVAVTLQKTWVNAAANDSVTITAGTHQFISVAAGAPNETDADAPFGVDTGSTIAISEAFTPPAAAGNYASNLACTGNTVPLSGGNLTVTAGDPPITCTFTNTLIVQPTLTKSFSPTSILSGGTSTLTFNIANPAGGTTRIVAFTDTLPVGLQVANSTVGGSCAGYNITGATAGSLAVTVSNLTMLAGTACTVTIQVTNKLVPTPQLNTDCTTNPAAFTNSATNISGLSNLDNLVQPSCLIVSTLPTLTKAFGPPTTITVGGTTVLTFTVNNTQAGSLARTGLAFTDTLPSSLILANGTVGGSCAGFTTNALAAGSTSIAVSNLSIAQNASCTITVNVTNVPQQVNPTCGTPPAFTNSSGNISGITGITNGVQPSCVVVNPLVPTLVKSFSPTTITVGGITVLTFTVSNPAANPALSNVGFVDTLPSGLQVANTTVGGTCANAAAATTVAAGGSTITVANLQVAAGASSCTVTVNVTNVPLQVNPSCSGDPQAFTNTTGNVALTNVSSGIQPSCVIVNPLVPSLNKAFSPTTMVVGGTTTLTFTVTNPAANNPAQAVSFVDTLPLGLQVAAVPAIGGTCAGGSVTALAGTNTITVAGKIVPNSTAAPSTCTITVAITNEPLQAGLCPAANFTNTASNISGIVNITNNVTDSCVNVTELQPTLTKSFSPSTFVVGGFTTLTFTITNPAAFNPAQVVSFTDTLPAGLQVAATPAVVNNCTGGTITAVAGSTSIGVAGTTVGASNAAPSSCTITVDVTNVPLQTNASCTGNPPSFTNAAGNIGGLVNLTNGVAPSCVTVTPLTPTLTKSFSPNTFVVGGFTTLTFTITNPASNNPLQVVSFTDTLPAGLQVAATPAVVNNCTGGTITAVAGSTSIGVAGTTVGASTAAPTSCTIAVNVTNVPGQVNASCTGNPPSFTNAAGNIGGLSNLNNGVQPSCVTVTPLTPTLTKSFSPNVFDIGGFTTLTFTVSNPANNPALSNVGFVDNLPSGLEIANPAAVGGTCSNAAAATTAVPAGTTITVASLNVPAGAASCTVTVNVTNKTGQVNPSCANNPAAFTNGAGNVSVTNVSNGVTNSCVVVNAFAFTITKTPSVGTVTPGSPLSFTVVITNNGPASANGAIITDPAIPFYTANAVSCLGTTGGATCPTPLTIAALEGAGMTVATFPALATITLRIDGISTLVSGQLVNTVIVSPPPAIPGVAQAVAIAVVVPQIGVIPTLSLNALIALMLLIGLGTAVHLRRARG